MARILGSIDNAAIWSTQYHLIFTETAVFQFELMSGKDWRKEMFYTQMSNPMRMVPVAGEVSSIQIGREESERMIEQDAAQGKEIEQNFDKIVSEGTVKFTKIEYGDINYVELSNGTPLSLPHLILQTKPEKLKFHLIRNSYKGKGSLPEDVFSSYANTLKQAFGDSVKIKG